jgi:hypothetical protein
MNASNFTLSGEGSVFTRVSIKIEKQSASGYSVVGTYPYANPQGYGHIVMSSFTVSDIGSYRATGLLTATSAVVATKTFTVQ